MRQRPALSVFALALALACASTEPDNPPSPEPQRERDAVQQSDDNPSEVSAAKVGETVTLVGRAVNRKGGATLVGEGFEVWMLDFDSWPDGYYAVGHEGKLLTVTGVLGQDHGLPVFVPKQNEPIVQGIPVPEGTDLERASQRFVLKNADWTPR